MEIKLYLRMLYRSWWIMVLTALAAMIAALIFSYLSMPVYQTQARFIVSPNTTAASSENSVINSLATLDKRSIVNTYAEVLNSTRIFQEATAGLKGADKLPGPYAWSAIILPDTNIVELTVKGPSPDMTALLANNIGQAAIAYVEGLYPIYNLRLLDPAVPAKQPISPQPLRDASIALFLGLAVGAVLALLRELLRTPLENFLQQSTIDGMSQALNRPAFEQRLQQMSRDSNELSLCLVELDGLKRYGEVLPQPTQQKILRKVTQSLKNQLRGNDLIGRWNDSEFAVLLSGTPGMAALNTMCRVQNVLSAPVNTDVSDEALELKPTIGIAEHQPGKSPEVLVMQAELALKSAFHNDKGISLGN